jgi:hypothetical protein
MIFNQVRVPRAPGRPAFLLIAGTLACGASTARAGELGLSLEAGYLGLTNAQRSAQAVFGNPAGGFTGGGSISYGIAGGVFVAVGARYFERTGERVFVADATGPVFGLGHPLKLRLVPAWAVVGYRYERRRGFPLTPYVAVGGGAVSYHEESEVGGLREGVLDQTKGAGYAMLGLELGRGGLRFGVEGTYARVPESASLGGVSRVYGEDDIGGFTVVGKLTFVP